MKILIITRSLTGGGAERVSAVLASCFNDLGHDVTIVTYQITSNDYPLDSSVKLVNHQKLNGFERVRSLRRLVTTEGYEKVISLGSKFQYIAAANLFDVSDVVLSERNDPGSFYTNAAQRAFVKHCYSKAWAVVFQTEQARRYFKRLDIKRSAVIMNPVSGLNCQWDEDHHSKLVVNYCRLGPQKNVELLIKAFAVFVRTHEQYRLIVFGEGSQERIIKSMVHSLGLDSKVELRPFTKNIHEEACKAEMFVSSADYEGLSNSLIEALAMGMPVISTDCNGGGAREIIGDNEFGILVSRGDAEEMASAMQLIADNPALRKTLSDKARRSATRFQPRTICSEWIHLMASIK